MDEQLIELKKAIEAEGYAVDLSPIRVVKLNDVVSSNIEKIGCRAKEHACDVYVKFKGSGVYKYEDVSVAEVEGLVKAESKGSYFAKVIKPTKKCTKL